MDFFETIKKRNSVRQYSQKPIEENLLVKIIDCGRLAPT
ncbi:MAG: nitroreductase family protein, partial [Candidatus Omnitrophica bacterium]|nr:nitroreductase family protein [Candidatus Omnitrophota bacterium]